jgi:hypothetical protein
MSYPGSPQNEQQPSGGGPYSFPDATAGGAYPPASGPAPTYGQPPNQAYTTQPVSPAYGAPTQQVGQVSPGYSPDYGQQVPQQPAPAHDQAAYGAPSYSPGTAQMPLYADPNATGYAPYGEAQMSGPPLGQPMSGPPVSGVPGAYGPPPAPAAKRGVAVPILASLLALAVIAAGVFIGLYVDKSGKLTKSQKLAADRQTTLTSTNAELDKTKKDLASKTDELTQAQQDLRGSKNDSDQAKKERDTIAKCLTLLTQALAAADSGDKATTQSKINEMKVPCDQAYTIIGIS